MSPLTLWNPAKYVTLPLNDPTALVALLNGRVQIAPTLRQSLLQQNLHRRSLCPRSLR
jgi:hypothetical protein